MLRLGFRPIISPHVKTLIGTSKMSIASPGHIGLVQCVDPASECVSRGRNAKYVRPLNDVAGVVEGQSKTRFRPPCHESQSGPFAGARVRQRRNRRRCSIKAASFPDK